MKQRFFAVALMLAVATPFFANDTFAQTTTVTDGGSELSGDKADEIITNRRLRASTGSLSRWSISTSWNYDAGSIEKPFDVERPNIKGKPGSQLLQALSGSVGVRYRLTDTESLTFSTGLAMAAPFHSSIDTDNPSTRAQFENNARKLNIDNPSISGTKIFKLAGIQNVASLSFTYYTTENLSNSYQLLGGATYSHQFIYDVKNTGFSFGALVQGAYYFNKGDQYQNQTVEGQPSHEIGLYPMAEYVINDTFNLRTIIGALVYDNIKSQPNDTFIKNKIYQSIGLGISISRDIFLYPNIQFLPENIRGDLTNIGMSANINIF